MYKTKDMKNHQPAQKSVKSHKGLSILRVEWGKQKFNRGEEWSGKFWITEVVFSISPKQQTGP